MDYCQLAPQHVLFFYLRLFSHAAGVIVAKLFSFLSVAKLRVFFYHFIVSHVENIAGTLKRASEQNGFEIFAVGKRWKFGYIVGSEEKILLRFGCNAQWASKQTSKSTDANEKWTLQWHQWYAKWQIRGKSNF